MENEPHPGDRVRVKPGEVWDRVDPREYTISEVGPNGSSIKLHGRRGWVLANVFEWIGPAVERRHAPSSEPSNPLADRRGHPDVSLTPVGDVSGSGIHRSRVVVRSARRAKGSAE